jgi:hypothetical protein
MNSRREDERPNLDLENLTHAVQELARVVMASPYLKLELFFGLEGFTARDPEGVRILTADVGVRTDKKTGNRAGALERLRQKKHTGTCQCRSRCWQKSRQSFNTTRNVPGSHCGRTYTPVRAVW